MSNLKNIIIYIIILLLFILFFSSCEGTRSSTHKQINTQQFKACHDSCKECIAYKYTNIYELDKDCVSVCVVILKSIIPGD